jgi:hypothetical protein
MDVIEAKEGDVVTIVDRGHQKYRVVRAGCAAPDLGQRACPHGADAVTIAGMRADGRLGAPWCVSAADLVPVGSDTLAGS